MNVPDRRSDQHPATAANQNGNTRRQLATQRYMQAIADEEARSAGRVPIQFENTAQTPRPETRSAPWDATLVGDVMTKNVIVVDEHASFKHIAETLVRNGVSALPVMNDAGHVVGVVSESDLFAKVAAGGELKARIGSGFTERHHLQRKALGETAADLMGAPAITAMATDTVVDAARTAAQEHIKRLPVVDEHERIVGILSRSDLLRAFLSDDAAIQTFVNRVVLEQQFVLSPTSITADVLEGVVTLRGRLDSEQVLGPLLEAVRGVAGVVAAHSELSFDEPFPHPPPTEFP